MRRSTAILLVAFALLIAASWGFAPEIVAIFWHLRHGMHDDGAGVRVRVPLLFTAIEGPSSIILMSPNGRARTRLSGEQGVLIFVSNKIPAPQNSSETVEQWWKRTSDAAGRAGAHETSSRALTIAGKPEHGHEFQGGMFQRGVEIWCVPDAPGGWFADYAGPAARNWQFYSILESAQAR